MADGERERLLEEIGRARERVVELERAQAAEASRITELEAQISALATFAAESPARNDEPAAQAAPRAPDSKLQIFRRLFRGREDVYPTRFESAKTGKHGYGPACANKFVTGLCELPKVKCGEYKNQKFFPADDAVAGRACA